MIDKGGDMPVIRIRDRVSGDYHDLPASTSTLDRPVGFDEAVGAVARSADEDGTPLGERSPGEECMVRSGDPAEGEHETGRVLWWLSVVA